MKILVIRTVAVVYYLALKLLERGYEVVGVNKSQPFKTSEHPDNLLKSRGILNLFEENNLKLVLSSQEENLSSAKSTASYRIYNHRKGN